MTEYEDASEFKPEDSAAIRDLEHSDSYESTIAYGEQQYADVLALLGKHGYVATFTQTGGMCAAIELTLPNDRTVLVTEREGPLEWNRADHGGWGVGVYDNEDAADALFFEAVEDGSSEALLGVLGSLI